MRDSYELLVQTILKRCQIAGLVRADIPARLLGQCLLNLMNWSIFWFNPTGKMSAEEFARVLQSIFLEGVLTPGKSGALHSNNSREGEFSPKTAPRSVNFSRVAKN